MSLDLELIIRILVGTALGAVIGYERDIHGRPAGLRTHALVALASATFMVVSTHLVYYQGYRQGDFTEIDGSRIAASVVSGIGFLAGGAILRTGLTIQGLTTAAALWLVAAIGLAAGAGMYAESISATILGVVALTLLRRFEDKDDRIKRRLTLTLTERRSPPISWSPSSPRSICCRPSRAGTRTAPARSGSSCSRSGCPARTAKDGS